MTRCTVLIATLDHVHTLTRALASVRAQSEADLEVFVVGDGAPPETDALMRAEAAADPRVSWFPHPKGAGHGELWRHQALQQATGEIVCYLGDDDLWLPHHVATMLVLLRDADFATTAHCVVAPSGAISVGVGDIRNRASRERMRERKYNLFGPTCAAHRLDAYRRLPHGWRPRPEGMWSDLHMWRQWIDQEWCRFTAHLVPTSLHFATSQRPHDALDQRCAEMDRWWAAIPTPEFAVALQSALLASWQAAPGAADPGLVAAAQAAGARLDDAGEPVLAEELARRLRTRHPKDPAVTELWCRHLLRRGRRDEALGAALAHDVPFQRRILGLVLAGAPGTAAGGPLLAGLDADQAGCAAVADGEPAVEPLMQERGVEGAEVAPPPPPAAAGAPLALLLCPAHALAGQRCAVRLAISNGTAVDWPRAGKGAVGLTSVWTAADGTTVRMVHGLAGDCPAGGNLVQDLRLAVPPRLGGQQPTIALHPRSPAGAAPFAVITLPLQLFNVADAVG